MKLWQGGNSNELLEESKTTKMPSNTTPMNIEKVSSKFKQLMEKGNLIGALRLLTNNMSNGIWSLSKEILQWLHLKVFWTARSS